MFCMLVRKRIEGGRICSVRQSGWDRVIEILVESTNDIGDLVKHVLVLEVMGKHSNLMLCQAGPNDRPARIVDSLVHVTKEMSRVRQVLPGLEYATAPPQNKETFEQIRAADVAALQLATLPEKERRLALCRLVAGMGPMTAGEVLHRVPPAANFSAPLVRQAVFDLFTATLDGLEQASVGLDELGIPVVAAPYQLTSRSHFHTQISFNDALDQVYVDVAVRSQLSALAVDLERSLTNHLDKLRGKREKLTRELDDSANHEEFRVRGELLTAYAHQVHKGTQEVELPNFYDDERPMKITLDPALTAIENARYYFKQGSKRKRAIPMLHTEIEHTSSDLRYLEETLIHLRDANKDNLLALQKELEQQGFVKARKMKSTARKSIASPSAGQPDSYVSVDGFIIRVGRNNLQNDKLTLRTSQDSDIWLHTKDIPGSHVVISTEKRDVPEATLHEAAILASYYSKGRNSTNVAVDYTAIKHVWKPNGARPGYVLYDHHKTLFVNPDRQRLDDITRRQPAR